jgi:hypothetical protein
MRQRRSYLTVRNVPADIAQELDRERKRRGDSLNETVLAALRKGLGLAGERKSNGLLSLAGQWSDEDFKTFERTVSESTEQIDEEDWR